MSEQENKKELADLFKENWLSVILALGGFVLVVIGGVVMVREGSYFKPEEEVLIEEESEEAGKIKVDIQGAIENPGVYELSSSSRVEDLLMTAGGLSEKADSDWVAQNLNQAAKLKDGEKYFIPQEGEVEGVTTAKTGKININKASAAELKALPDIGKVRSQDIIDARPYSKTEDLLDKEVISSSIFEKIKDKISVY
ncbi:ComEA family DNA-binding protein [Candidatus Microgenomates bacterium]|nr:ComEA family DNA-binding protein [Candidatus Microgenomates bacterium]